MWFRNYISWSTVYNDLTKAARWLEHDWAQVEHEWSQVEHGWTLVNTVCYDLIKAAQRLEQECT